MGNLHNNTTIAQKIQTWNVQKINLMLQRNTLNDVISDLENLIFQRNTLNDVISDLENKHQIYESLYESIKRAGGNPDEFDDIPNKFLDTLANNNIRFIYEPKVTK